MKEMLDILDENGNFTGILKERALVHHDGDAHATSHVWLVRHNCSNAGTGYDILLQLRSDDKDSFPGCYDTSSAGHVPAGQDYLTSAVRELYEELGIQVQEHELNYIGKHEVNVQSVFHGDIFRDHEISRVYLLEKDIDKRNMRLQDSEVADVLWMNFDECVKKLRSQAIKNCVCMEELDMLAEYLGSCGGTDGFI